MKLNSRECVFARDILFCIAFKSFSMFLHFVKLFYKNNDEIINGKFYLAYLYILLLTPGSSKGMYMLHLVYLPRCCIVLLFLICT